MFEVSQTTKLVKQRGFALVSALLLMMLLAMVAVSLLGLSSVALRSSGQTQAAAVARANARLAMIMALGELQAGMGPDQRVSATATTVSDGKQLKNPHLTGVWDSWRWNPGSGGSPSYSDKAGKFRSWLVSSPQPEAAKELGLPGNEPKSAAIELAGDFENNGIPGSVRAERVPVNSTRARGGFAWAAFDESTKAAIDLGNPPDSMPLVEDIALRSAPARFRADVVGDNPSRLESLQDPRHLVSLETAAVPAAKNAQEIRRRFHDFTTGSLGLLTDTANGGLKTDLTQLFEAEKFDADAFPETTLYADRASGAPRWDYLYEHYRKYKAITSGASGTPTYALTTRDLSTMTDEPPTRPSDGLRPSPVRPRLMPVIARMQLIFSLVSHNSHWPERVNFFNAYGEPKGNDKHAVPHVVYEPVITLYNPYNVALDLRKLRVRVWDPPVGFRFAKVSSEKGLAWYRQEMAAGEYHGLARFNYLDERNPAARRFFTMYLTDGTADRAGTRLRLQPGEVKVYSARVERNWSWSLENSNLYTPRSFFDWGRDRNFGNRDNRTANEMGVEAVPGWDARAGLQTDHMSYGWGRPENTIYDFEKKPGGMAHGWISIRMTDEVLVEMKAQRSTGTDTSVPDFRVDLLAGNNADHSRDILRTYQFRFQDPTAEISEDPEKPLIKRQYKVSQILQAWNERGLGGKKCLAMLEMTARTTHDPQDDSKAWVYNNPVVEGVQQDTRVVGAANQTYDLRLLELPGWTSFPMVEWDSAPGSGYGRGYFGASRSSSEGVTNVPMHAVPLAPAASLGDLIPTNLVAGSAMPRVVHPLGNSRAHPLIESNQVMRSLNGTLLDHSYLINDTLWDRYYFSSATDYSGAMFTPTRSRREVIEGMLTGSKPSLNRRLVAVSPAGDSQELAKSLDGLDDATRARRMAAYFGVNGPFNLNSTSVDAWHAVLSSLRDRQVTAWNQRVTTNDGMTPFVRGSLPLAGPSDTSGDVNVLGQIRWAGYRNLADKDIRRLAEMIVEEIRKRGASDKAPLLTVAEFVNRRPGSAGDLHSLAGILQTAIDRSGVNATNHAMDSWNIAVASINPARIRGVVTPSAMDGFTGEGSPPILTQGDLMGALAPIATVRADTFKIRAYGEATSASGVVEARAWCEAVVQRVPEFVDPADPPETLLQDLDSKANQRFGRRFVITSFRWLNAGEI